MATINRVGMGSLSLLCNISYAGMRAQDRPETVIPRAITFIGGLPFTLVTYFAVDKGSNKTYGIMILSEKDGKNNDEV